MRNRRYSDETRAAAMAALLQGQSVSGVARDYNIPKGTISGWKKKATEQLEAGGVAENATQKGKIGDLLLAYLEASITALREQALVFGDPNWLQTQEASELAVLHGVMTDKAVRLLEAMTGASDEHGAS